MSDLDVRVQLKKWRNAKDWWSARDEISRLRESGGGDVDPEYLLQQAALCTYKDPELRRDAALQEALTFLLGEPRRALAEVTDAETAGLVGAVMKRRWE